MDKLKIYYKFLKQIVYIKNTYYLQKVFSLYSYDISENTRLWK